jgi:hypothetical protein
MMKGRGRDPGQRKGGDRGKKGTEGWDKRNSRVKKGGLNGEMDEKDEQI